MRLRIFLFLLITNLSYGADWFLLDSGSRGLGNLALSTGFALDASTHNPAVLPKETTYQLLYSPMWSDYGIQEMGLSVHHKALPLKPVFQLHGQMHELINSYLAMMQFQLYQSESLDIGAALEWSMLQIKKENATQSGHFSMGFVFRPLEKMSLGVSYLHIAEFPERELMQQMPLFNLAINYELEKIVLMASYQKAEQYKGAPALGIQAHYKELLYYGLAWNGSNEMLSANLSFAWRRVEFRQAAGWHRWLGLIPVWSIEYQGLAD